MSDERISQPVSHVDTPYDRSADTPRYEAVEEARARGRRPPRRGLLASSRARRGDAQAASDSFPHHEDGVRGTRLDVVA